MRPLVSAASCCHARDSVLATNGVCFEQIGQVSEPSESKTRTLQEIAFRLESHRDPIKHRCGRMKRETVFQSLRDSETLSNDPENSLFASENRAPRVCELSRLFDTTAESIFEAAAREPNQGWDIEQNSWLPPQSRRCPFPGLRAFSCRVEDLRLRNPDKQKHNSERLSEQKNKPAVPLQKASVPEPNKAPAVQQS